MWLSWIPGVALAAPTLTAPTMVSGDDTIGAAAGTQFDPVLVEGDGTQWLLAWTDTRAHVAGMTGGGVSDVWGVRLDSDGVPIDLVSFPIASGPWREDSPRAAYGDGAWLVSFDADAPTKFYYGQGVYAVRLDDDAVLLDPTPFLVQDAQDDTEATWDVASDGTDWAVLIQAVDGPSFVLDGAVVTSGAQVTHRRVFTPSNNVAAPWNARLAWNVDRYLAVWSAWASSGDDIQGLLLDVDLAALGPLFDVAGGGELEVMPSVAAGNGEFYVAWKDHTFGAFWVEVEGTPVDPTGAVAVPGGQVLSDTQWPGYPQPDVAWDGNEWVTAWETYASVWFTHTDDVGAVRAMEEGYAGGVEPVLAERMDGVLAAWTAYPVYDGWQFGGDIVGAAVEGDGTLDASAPLAVGTPAHVAPKIAGDGDQWLVVTQSLSGMDSRILAWRLDELALPIDAEPIEIAVGSGLTLNPAVAWNGDEYLVVWEDTSQVLGVRVDTDGVILDATPISIVVGNEPAVAASGTDFLVVSTHEPIDHVRNVLGARVDTDGVVLDPAALFVGSSYARDPDVTGSSSGWVVAWEHYATHDTAVSSIIAATVAPLGTVGPPLWVAVNGGTTQHDPSIASDGKVTLFVWSGDGNVRGRSMNAAGTFKGSDAGFVINQKNNDQFGTAVAWDGSRFQTAWTDWRIHEILEPGEGDVYTTAVAANGTVKDKVGKAIAADPDVPEGNVAVAAANGRAVFAWTKLHDESPYASFRIETSFYGELPAPMIGAADGEHMAMAEAEADDQAGGCSTAPAAGELAGLLGILALRRRRSSSRR